MSGFPSWIRCEKLRLIEDHARTKAVSQFAALIYSTQEDVKIRITTLFTDMSYRYEN